jgi:flagellin-like protein
MELMSLMTLHRRALSPVLGTVIIVGVTIVLAVYASYGYSGVTETNTRYIVLAFEHAYCKKPVTVENAGWEIEMLLTNKGSHNLYIKKLLVNEKPVIEYGLLHDGKLSSNKALGTSIPDEGITLIPGQSIIEYLWVGHALYSKGSSIEIQVDNINDVAIKRYVLLE